jgi:D-3-phosphoglycerate dehydrogenase
MPGMIGKIGNALGSRNVNIARMGVGREGKLGRALMLISVDDPVDKKVIEELRTLQNFNEVRYVTLSQMHPKEYMNI